MENPHLVENPGDQAGDGNEKHACPDNRCLLPLGRVRHDGGGGFPPLRNRSRSDRKAIDVPDFCAASLSGQPLTSPRRDFSSSGMARILSEGVSGVPSAFLEEK